MKRKSPSKSDASDAPHLQRRPRRRRLHRRHRAVQHRARRQRTAESGRAAAALRRAGRHRPGLLARRRDRGPASSRSSACPSCEIMNGDTETKVDVARSRAEQLISQGAQLLIGAFDSGQTTAIAQVAEQKGIPLVINIAAPPPITEQGYKFVFRNFPTAKMILGDAFANQKEVFAQVGRGAEDGGVPARQRHLRHGDGGRHQARDAALQHALQDRRRRSPTIRRRATSRSKSPRPRRPAPRRS